MKQRRYLESMLCSMPHRKFQEPKIELEQYPTSPELAASIILMALSKGDAGPGNTVADLGCGCGILGLGFALAGSDWVYLLDCDSSALQLARDNVQMLEEEELIGSVGMSQGDCDDQTETCCRGVELIQAKVKYNRPRQAKTSRGGRGGRGRGGGRGRKGRGRGGASARPANDALYQNPLEDQDDGIPLPRNAVDTVITNPPFGTKHNEGIDVQFLKVSIRLARKAVYSFHKTSTRAFLLKLLKGWGLQAEVVAEMKFDIKNAYKFHKQKSVDVDVDLLRIWFEDEQADERIEGRGDFQESELDDGEELPLGLCGHA
mmetsp:Transcript_724/g.1744  ORF Transcript_724/g.1744 Transcript_724/m.1744 type:complete len:317 (-) Transcript_724:34-984(-)